MAFIFKASAAEQAKQRLESYFCHSFLGLWKWCRRVYIDLMNDCDDVSFGSNLNTFKDIEVCKYFPIAKCFRLSASFCAFGLYITLKSYILVCFSAF